MDTTPTPTHTAMGCLRPTPTSRDRSRDSCSPRSARRAALKNSRNPGGQKPEPVERGRTERRLPEFNDRQRSRSRNYDIFLPKHSHLHTPRRQDTCSNPDKITRFTSPTRTLNRTELGTTQNYRTSLSAVCQSKEDLGSSLDNLDSSNDQISIHSDSPFRNRNDFAFRSLPHGRSGERFRSLESKTSRLLREYHRDKDKLRLELYDIRTGIDRSGASDIDDDRTPTDQLINGHATPQTPRAQHVTFGSVTPSVTSSGSIVTSSSERIAQSSSSDRITPLIKVSDVNGNQGGKYSHCDVIVRHQDNGKVMENGNVPLKGGKPLITAEYYCVKRVNYNELKQKFGEENTDNVQTDEAVKKLQLMSVNGDKESGNKKTLASSISNFFRKMSPRLHRKSRGSGGSSNSSAVDEEESSSANSSPAHVPKIRDSSKARASKSPLASPIRRFMNSSKKQHLPDKPNSKHNHNTEAHVATTAENDEKMKPETPKTKPDVVKRDLELSRSCPPRTLNVEGVSECRLEVNKHRGLLTTTSTDSIGDCSLDINMAGSGSEPSLTSGHQSVSVSKRTLHSSEPNNKPSSNPDVPENANQRHNYSYLGLSVSVGGYPKYRSYRNQPGENEDVLKNADHHEKADVIDHDKSTGALVANQTMVISASTDIPKTDNSEKTDVSVSETTDIPVSEKTDLPEKSKSQENDGIVNGMIKSNYSATSDDDVFLPGDRSSQSKERELSHGDNGVSNDSTEVVDGGATVHGAGDDELQRLPVVLENKKLAKALEMRRDSCWNKDGNYFLAMVEAETSRIKVMVNLAQQDLDQPGKSEEVYGKLRAAIGKANLLVTQKFQQFKGLCESNLRPEKGSNLVTTNQDLAGFWDMVSLQVEDVNAAFSEIQEMRDNDWTEVPGSTLLYRTLSTSSQKDQSAGDSKPVKRTPKKTGTGTPSKSKSRQQADKGRDEARKRLMEAKKLARRKRLTSGGSVDDVEIFISEPEKH